VSMDEGRFIVAGKSFISATSESKNAYGVFTKNEGTADFDGDATIIVSGAVGSDLGVTAQKGGSVNFNRGVKIVADKYSLYATTNSDDGKQSTINVNQSGGSDVVIIGDVLADNNAVINMKLDTADSYFSGVATAVCGGSGDGIVDLQLANQARWDMKADSTVSALQVADGGVVDMSAAAGYQKLTTGTFTGNGGILIMDTDMSSGESDQLIITDSASAGGTQKYWSRIFIMALSKIVQYCWQVMLRELCSLKPRTLIAAVYIIIRPMLLLKRKACRELVFGRAAEDANS
ncbi:MAG: hypothetical protein LUH17_07680, partial [Acidaminococcaceae bacterium]|nr:hypothetical protein [Acidaminococcaceae bacterium]